ARTVALIVVTVILALFTIVFAELVPKSLALANAERVALTLARPIELLARLLGPVIAGMTGITNTVARMLGIEINKEASITAEELRLIVERGGEQGVLEAEEEQMINAVIELGSRRVHEVMVPRIAMATIQATATFDEAIETIVEHGHSRIPVYDESVDEILGILYAKDLLPFLRESAGPRPDLRTLLRTPVYIPESMTVDDLAELFDTNLGLEDEDEYDTVGGLIYHRIGGVPTPGDRVEVDGLTLTVESTDGRRVGKVLAVRRRDENGGPTPDEDGDR
ncbi:MAG TPA: hemolysin family protein, partial [Candidatus Limnocylindrales bacterium]|nr:hemolysin family protein [Candidatus Limnocylindrales bacterium]